MNRNEYKFYKKLDSAFGSEFKILPQVHLDELARPETGLGDLRTSSVWHINQKSVDFVICNKNTLSPLVAIELDGDSHSRSAIKDRDAEVERILTEAELRLVRFNIKDENSVEYIKEKVLNK